MCGQAFCFAAANWLSSICDFDRRCTQWSVPINPAVVSVPRFMVSGREWLLPTAAKFLPVAVLRAARFCLPEHSRLWVAHISPLCFWAKWEWKQGEWSFRPAPFFSFGTLLKYLAVHRLSFSLLTSLFDLEIHKVFLRSNNLSVWKNLSRCTDNLLLRACQGILWKRLDTWIVYFGLKDAVIHKVFLQSCCLSGRKNPSWRWNYLIYRNACRTRKSKWFVSIFSECASCPMGGNPVVQSKIRWFMWFSQACWN